MEGCGCCCVTAALENPGEDEVEEACEDEGVDRQEEEEDGDKHDGNGDEDVLERFVLCVEMRLAGESMERGDI